MTGRLPRALAHRGASGHALENSREAFRRARALGADGVELDVHASADGAMVVHHDPDLPGAGPIAGLDRQQVTGSRLPNGEAVPLLDEVLDLLGPLEVWVEIKSLPAKWDAALLAVLREGPAPDRYAIHSFDHRIVARLGRTEPTLRRGILLASYPIGVQPLLASAGARALWQVHHLIDRDMVTEIHEMDAELIAWTADAPAEIARLERLGVDAICSNFPERIRAQAGPSPA